MKPHPVLRFSSSDEEDEYSSSSKISIRPQAQKKASTKLFKSELVEISTDSDESMAVQQITSDKSLSNKSIDTNKTCKLPVRSFHPSKQNFAKTNKLAFTLDDYDYEYTDVENYSNENESKTQPEENSKRINLIDSQQNIYKENSSTLEKSYPINSVNNSNSANLLLLSPKAQDQNVISQPNEHSCLNATDDEDNSEEYLINSVNHNLSNRNDNANNQSVLPIYRCRREASKISGRPINFKFYRSDTQIMTAIAKGLKNDKIEIFLDGVVVSKLQKKHSKSKSIEFDMFKEPENQLEAEIIFTHKKESQPREVSIRVYDPSIGLPNKIESIKPKYNKNKKMWQMNFKGKFVLRSIKNTILGDDQMNKLMYVRKTANNVLDIDILEEIDEIFIFSFVISSFLCKI